MNFYNVWEIDFSFPLIVLSWPYTSMCWCLFPSLLCESRNKDPNNREAGDLRRHPVHYDVSVMNKNVLLTLTSMCLYIHIYMHIDPYVLCISICICICVIFILFNWFHYLCPRRTWSLALIFWQTVLYLLLVSLHPLLATIYCEIEIRAHKPRLSALIVMKECYQFFSKRCTLYLLPEHVEILYWLHVCCFVYWMEIM